ncbi:hypothetical protein NH340_JMT08440 [Sarcoptes scabiei]|nr:hypothetical protein NH340_JMT08440 [Sarcoptes scabiei]
MLMKRISNSDSRPFGSDALPRCFKMRSSSRSFHATSYWSTSQILANRFLNSIVYFCLLSILISIPIQCTPKSSSRVNSINSKSLSAEDTSIGSKQKIDEYVDSREGNLMSFSKPLQACQQIISAAISRNLAKAFTNNLYSSAIPKSKIRIDRFDHTNSFDKFFNERNSIPNQIVSNHQNGLTGGLKRKKRNKTTYSETEKAEINAEAIDDNLNENNSYSFAARSDPNENSLTNRFILMLRKLTLTESLRRQSQYELHLKSLAKLLDDQIEKDSMKINLKRLNRPNELNQIDDLNAIELSNDEEIPLIFNSYDGNLPLDNNQRWNYEILQTLPIVSSQSKMIKNKNQEYETPRSKKILMKDMPILDNPWDKEGIRFKRFADFHRSIES